MTANAYRAIMRNEARNTINFNTAITSYSYRDSMHALKMCMGTI